MDVEGMMNGDARGREIAACAAVGGEMPTGFRRFGAIDRVLMLKFDERVQDTKAVFSEIATRSPGRSVSGQFS